MANFFESGFTVLQELAKLKEKEKKIRHEISF